MSQSERGGGTCDDLILPNSRGNTQAAVAAIVSCSDITGRLWSPVHKSNLCWKVFCFACNFPDVAVEMQVRWDLGRAATHFSHHAEQQWHWVLKSSLPASGTLGEFARPQKPLMKQKVVQYIEYQKELVYGRGA